MFTRWFVFQESGYMGSLLVMHALTTNKKRPSWLRLLDNTIKVLSKKRRDKPWQTKREMPLIIPRQAMFSQHRNPPPLSITHLSITSTSRTPLTHPSHRYVIGKQKLAIPAWLTSIVIKTQCKAPRNYQWILTPFKGIWYSLESCWFRAFLKQRATLIGPMCWWLCAEWWHQ